MIPPNVESTIASNRNCIMTSLANAPIAKRMPISRVRSVTDTSMMFMMPMPPTTRLTAAIAPKSAVIALVVLVTVSAISAMSRTLKSSSEPSGR